jgi:hypothetical protein
MRFYTLTFLSGLMILGLAAECRTVAQSTALPSIQSEQQTLQSNSSRSRSTSYRGSGRRAIMAFPAIPLLEQPT